MLSVSIDDIKQDLAHYIEQIDYGEKLLILQADEPIAELKLISNSKKTRPFGLCKGEFIVPENFDEPLPENIIREFEGK
jgi:antitoxin (DNA-binding transcriptional repressor) of toxin-antitoxin stability system